MSNLVRNRPYVYLGVKQDSSREDLEYQIAIAIPVYMSDTLDTPVVQLQTVNRNNGVRITCNIIPSTPANTIVVVKRPSDPFILIPVGDVDADGEIEIIIKENNVAVARDQCNAVFRYADRLGSVSLLAADPLPMALVRPISGTDPLKFETDSIIVGDIEANDNEPGFEVAIAGKPPRKVKIPPKPVNNGGQ